MISDLLQGVMERKPNEREEYPCYVEPYHGMHVFGMANDGQRFPKELVTRDFTTKKGTLIQNKFKTRQVQFSRM